MTNEQRAEKIKGFVFDVDGTLTDGKIYISSEGEFCKAFNVKDGLAIAVLVKMGYKAAIITGRKSMIVEKRAQELGIKNVYQGVRDKLAVFEEFCQKEHLAFDEVAYAGDDLNDIKVMCKVGLACAPYDAANDIKEVAHFISSRDAGQGAIREVIEFVMKAQGKWQDAINSFR